MKVRCQVMVAKERKRGRRTGRITIRGRVGDREFEGVLTEKDARQLAANVINVTDDVDSLSISALVDMEIGE